MTDFHTWYQAVEKELVDTGMTYEEVNRERLRAELWSGMLGLYLENLLEGLNVQGSASDTTEEEG